MQPVAPVRAGVRPVADAPRASLDTPDSLSGRLERYFELARLLETPVPRRDEAARALQREQRDEMRAALAARSAVQAEIAAVSAAIDAPATQGAVRDLKAKLARECDKQQRNFAEAARLEAMVAMGREGIPPLEAELSARQRESRAWAELNQCFADILPKLASLEVETRGIHKIDLGGWVMKTVAELADPGQRDVFLRLIAARAHEPLGRVVDTIANTIVEIGIHHGAVTCVEQVPEDLIERVRAALARVVEQPLPHRARPLAWVSPVLLVFLVAYLARTGTLALYASGLTAQDAGRNFFPEFAELSRASGQWTAAAVVLAVVGLFVAADRADTAALRRHDADEAARSLALARSLVDAIVGARRFRQTVRHLDNLTRKLAAMDRDLQAFPTMPQGAQAPVLPAPNFALDGRQAFQAYREYVVAFEKSFTEAAPHAPEYARQATAGEAALALGDTLATRRNQLAADLAELEKCSGRTRAIGRTIEDLQRELSKRERAVEGARAQHQQTLEALRAREAQANTHITTLAEQHARARVEAEDAHAARERERLRLQEEHATLLPDAEVLEALAQHMTVPAFERVQSRHLRVGTEDLARRVEMGEFSNWAGESVSAPAAQASSYDSLVHLLVACRDALRHYRYAMPEGASRAVDVWVEHTRALGVTVSVEADGSRVESPAVRSRASFIVDETGRARIDHIFPA